MEKKIRTEEFSRAVSMGLLEPEEVERAEAAAASSAAAIKANVQAMTRG